MTRALRLLLLFATLGLSGCDELLLFDVGPDGRILAPVDAEGRVVGVGDASQPRHLVQLDPVSGEARRLTRVPLALACPRVCGEGVTLVEGGKRLVHLAADGSARVLYESGQRLFQPTPSPSGSRVAVLEAARVGVPGTLHLIDARSGEAGEPVEGALPGFAWSGEALLVARRAAAEAEPRPFEAGPGEVLLLRGAERRVVFQGALPGVMFLAPGKEAAICTLARLGRPDSLGLGRLSLGGAGVEPGEQAEGLDLWPCLDKAGRVLFTRSRPGRATLEGELRLTSLAALGTSERLPTPGPVCAPRFVKGDLVAYLTPDGRLVTQAVDGNGLVDWTERLCAVAGGSP